ncbi:hypothetical protein K3888_02300 [Dietzia aurantiaca]|uniref:hypothetical protein n=1 Tax=Dietzia aurantiaca TaxID=983873 RepID=UPI001E2EEF34|nr:hypothetical protein [Dietzia aurantiaca]MCD2261523.1 hypothetical protein [Dietzia aurantiaca]
MTYWRPHPAITAVVYLLAITVPIAIVLAVIGSSPTLLEKVPEEHRGTVAAFGDGAARLSGSDGGIFGFDDAGASNSTVQGLPLPRHGDWSLRRPGGYPPPAGLTSGIDYSVQISEDGHITHWPCEHEIPVRSFDATPGSEGDLIWAIETLAFASGLPLRYAGPGTDDERDAEGAISVFHGDHPMFSDPEVAGVGGVAAWPHGLVLQGAVTLRPGQVTPYPGDPWSRSLTLHELMHAVGVDHAVPYGPEVMAERPGPYPPTILGAGDQFALHMVGCR